MTLDELKTYLVSKGVATAAAIFTGVLPATPDRCLSLQEYGGSAPEGGFGVAGIKREFPRIQVLARGPAGDYQVARALAEAAYVALSEVSTQTLGTTYYDGVWPVQSPFLLGRDANDRVQIAFNVEVAKERSA